MEEDKSVIKEENQDLNEIKENISENVKEEALEDKKELVDNKVKDKKEKKSKKKINKQIVALVCIIVACIVITVGLVVLKIRDINKKYPKLKSEDVFETEDKIEDPDAIYVADENTTYFFNELNVETIYEKDGKIIPSDASYEEKRDAYSYPKISGLKNKEIENKINEDIRSNLIDLINREGIANATINASFSNILSVKILTNTGGIYSGLNYDLNTGNKIQFEDLFVKSTPIKAILANSLGRANAWRSRNNRLMEWREEKEKNGTYDSDEYWKKSSELSNLDNIDFSESDDFLLKVSNAYDNLKGNINFCVSPFEIEIYNDFPTVLESGYNNAVIDVYEYYQYFTIFKKYSGSGKSIYETTNTMQENIKSSRYMPMNYFYMKKDRNIVCEDLTDNLFADIAVIYSDDDDNVKKAIDITKTNVNNVINDVKLTTQQDKSHKYVLQGQIYCWKHDEYSQDYEIKKYLKPYIKIDLKYNITKFDEDKYKNINYYFGKLATWPKVTTVASRFEEFVVQDMPGVSATDNTLTWYFDIDGNYVGTDKNLLIDYEREEMYYNPS